MKTVHMEYPEGCAAALRASRKVSRKVSRKCLRETSRKALFDAPCGVDDMQTIIQNRCHNLTENNENKIGRQINLISLKMEPAAFRAGSWAPVGSSSGFEKLRLPISSRCLAPPWSVLNIILNPAGI